MLVDQPMVRELTEIFLKDQPLIGFEVTFRRKDFVNVQAQEASSLYKMEKYEGQGRYELLLKCVEIYKKLQSEGVLLNDEVLKEHAWIRKYLPIFSADMFSQMMYQYQNEYNFTDPDESCMQCATAFMLAYHSNPQLFNQNPLAFEALAHSWSEALLTFNCRKMPMLALEIDGWHDHPYYSTGRNLIFFKICSEQFLKISQNFSNLLGLEKWYKRVVIFDSILKMLPFVVADHNKMDSHAFLDAIQMCQGLEENRAALQNDLLPDYTPSNEELEPTDIAMAAQNVPPVYLTAEAQEANEEGMKLIQQGINNLFLAQSLMDQKYPPQVEENQDEEVDNHCCIL